MERTIGEVSALCGISIRALRFYDEIGLLKPSGVSAGGYRLYDERAIGRLQQILLFRELQIPLKQIRDILARPDYDSAEALRRQRALLTLRRDRLDRLIGLVDDIMEGEGNMDFHAFDDAAIEKAKREYAEEARQRWGDTEAYRQSAERTASYGPADWAAIQTEADGIYRRFVQAMPEGPDSEQARGLAAEWQAHITARYYECTDEILSGLAEMYVDDQRFTKNIDRYAEGLARFMRDAIRSHLRNR
ncbi:MAG: MerR family transcriptional regulator [Clostridiales bacterium]|nr:MerR family transcriptional regulator [Clostridiales bacterium]